MSCDLNICLYFHLWMLLQKPKGDKNQALVESNPECRKCLFSSPHELNQSINIRLIFIIIAFNRVVFSPSLDFNGATKTSCWKSYGLKWTQAIFSFNFILVVLQTMFKSFVLPLSGLLNLHEMLYFFVYLYFDLVYGRCQFWYS